MHYNLLLKIGRHFLLTFLFSISRSSSSSSSRFVIVSYCIFSLVAVGVLRYNNDGSKHILTLAEGATREKERKRERRRESLSGRSC